MYMYTYIDSDVLTDIQIPSKGTSLSGRCRSIYIYIYIYKYVYIYSPKSRLPRMAHRCRADADPCRRSSPAHPPRTPRAARRPKSQSRQSTPRPPPPSPPPAAGKRRKLESRFQVRFPGIDFHRQSARFFLLALMIILTLYSRLPANVRS